MAGIDPVLIDAYGCINYFSLKPQELAHVKFAAEAGVGEMDVEKAAAAGRLRIFDLGQPTPTPTPTMTASPTNAPTATITTTPTMGPTPTPTRVPTNTPLPTPEPVATRAAAALKIEGRGTPTNAVVNPASFLGALLPAAAVVIGAGVVVRQRLDREPPHGPDTGKSDAPEEAGDAGEPPPNSAQRRRTADRVARRAVQIGFLLLSLYPLFLVIYQRVTFRTAPNLASWLLPWIPSC